MNVSLTFSTFLGPKTFSKWPKIVVLFRQYSFWFARFFLHSRPVCPSVPGQHFSFPKVFSFFSFAVSFFFSFSAKKFSFSTTSYWFSFLVLLQFSSFLFSFPVQIISSSKSFRIFITVSLLLLILRSCLELYSRFVLLVFCPISIKYFQNTFLLKETCKTKTSKFCRGGMTMHLLFFLLFAPVLSRSVKFYL